MKDYIKLKTMEETELRLIEFLNKKPLFYKEIDYDRMPNCWNEIKDNFKLPKKTIHIIGTNGKGSTGRFLAYYLYKMGFNVGHYTSPHIMKFNERIWINGNDIADEILEKNHQKLQKIISEYYLKRLSYFEYTTLLAMKCFENLDYVILEAGLGGERDATSVFDRYISLVTTIDIDHQSFLGNTIEEIAKTKLNSIKTTAIIGKQIHTEVMQIASHYPSFLEFMNKNELTKIKCFIKENDFASYLADNLSLALAFIKKENLEFNLDYLKGIELKGRLQKIDKNLYIDVGHNPLAARAILNEFQGKKINLIYNTYEDKDYKEILSILKPIINKLFIINVKNDRIADKNEVMKTAKDLGIKTEEFKKLEDNLTLVFGSFSVVEKFLKNYKK
jgi:dihydrofolate synthase/folylpolyglutamate synthase